MTAPKPVPSTKTTSSAVTPAKVVLAPADPTAGVAPIIDVQSADGETIAQVVEAGIMKNPVTRTALALVIAVGGTVQFVAANAYIALSAAHIVTAAPVWLAVYGAIFSPIATVGGYVWKANINGKKS
jgi:hypothetical protein